MITYFLEEWKEIYNTRMKKRCPCREMCLYFSNWDSESKNAMFLSVPKLRYCIAGESENDPTTAMMQAVHLPWSEHNNIKLCVADTSQADCCVLHKSDTKDSHAFFLYTVINPNGSAFKGWQETQFKVKPSYLNTATSGVFVVGD